MQSLRNNEKDLKITAKSYKFCSVYIFLLFQLLNNRQPGVCVLFSLNLVF